MPKTPIDYSIKTVVEGQENMVEKLKDAVKGQTPQVSLAALQVRALNDIFGALVAIARQLEIINERHNR